MYDLQNNDVQKFKEWAIEQHRSTNHLYDGLPYEIHLRLTVQEVDRAIQRIIKSKGGIFDDRGANLLRCAGWGHDLIEDTRVTYNDVKNKIGPEVADIIFAVTNEKGKTREERANATYYKGIRETPGASFIKCCDRIANIRWGALMGGSMLNRYKIEHDHFVSQVMTPAVKDFGFVERMEKILQIKTGKE